MTLKLKPKYSNFLTLKSLTTTFEYLINEYLYPEILNLFNPFAYETKCVLA